MAVAAPYVIPSSALGADGRAPASEHVVMASIGCGDQGTSDLRGFMSFGETQIVATCDPVTDHRENAKNIVNTHYNNKDCASINDFREILARDDIDAMHVGTPDHWHAVITINACRNGKDVYCQKPQSLTIREGRAMVSAARSGNRGLRKPTMCVYPNGLKPATSASTGTSRRK